MMELEFAQLSDRGRERDHNEDYVGCAAPENPVRARTHGWLFALADGVGGQENGEVASRLAVEGLLEDFRQAPPGELHAHLLPRLVQSANRRIHESAMEALHGAAGMASTLVACALRFDRACVAHVGDSRCYLIRRGNVRLLTRDHTVASEQVRLGLLSPEMAAEASTRHVLNRSLGADLFVSAEVSEVELRPDDVLLLCSDGLSNAVTAAEIAAQVREPEALETAAQALVRIANGKDGSDNISVQLIRIRSVERVGMYRGRPYRLR